MGSSKGINGDLSWAKLLSEQHSSTGANRPTGDGWKTMRELLDLSPFGDNKTRELVKQKIDAGSVEAFSGSAFGKNGILGRRVWYRNKDSQPIEDL